MTKIIKLKQDDLKISVLTQYSLSLFAEFRTGCLEVKNQEYDIKYDKSNR